MTRRGLMIAGTGSGVGKTMITLGLLRAFAQNQNGVQISAAKAGPDYLDPMYHSKACGVDCINLDAWAMTPDTLRGRAYALAGTHTIIEGAMGLYDAARDGQGSAAQLAHILGVPVVLVVDVQGMGQSVAAMVRGYHTHGCPVAGVILNRVGSARHEAMLRDALATQGVSVLGCIPRAQTLNRPSRHLGLVQALEDTDVHPFIDAAADIMRAHCDLDALLTLCAPLQDAPIARTPKPADRIAIARDAAFGFCYPHQVQDWTAQGAQISYFSPLANQAPDDDAQFIFLPGGYPELYAPQLAHAHTFRQAMQNHAKTGTQIYGECGGYMVLGQALIDADGQHHDMLGLLDVTTTFATRSLHLGYHLVDNGRKGHVFHYATIAAQSGTPLWQSNHADDVAGLQDNNVRGSFLHVI